MASTHDAQSWLDTVISAAGELAETTFGSEIETPECSKGVPHGLEGSLLPIQHGGEVLQFGVFASHDGCVDLTRALLQMEEDEECDEEAIPDAVGEIVNILAGIVQRRLAESGGLSISLGLPVYVRGEIFPPHKSEAVSAALNLGPAQANLVVVRGDIQSN